MHPGMCVCVCVYDCVYSMARAAFTSAAHRVILGASSVAQLQENAVAASAGPLPPAVVEALDAANVALHPVPGFPAGTTMPLQKL